MASHEPSASRDAALELIEHEAARLGELNPQSQEATLCSYSSALQQLEAAGALVPVGSVPGDTVVWPVTARGKFGLPNPYIDDDTWPRRGTIWILVDAVTGWDLDFGLTLDDATP